MTEVYFDDMQIGDSTKAGPYALTRDEIIEFATRYDPRPFHVDEDAAAKSIFGGLTAASAHTFAIAQALAYRWQPAPVILAALSFDEMSLPTPARPGDELFLTSTLIEKRESKSKPDRGVGRFHTQVRNGKGEVVLDYKITVLLARRS
jgi:acyl dehydratase